MENDKNNKQKLNIAIVCDPITDYVAGSFVSALRFAEILSARGHKIIFIASKSPNNNDTDYYKDIKIYRFFGILLPKSEKSLYISFPAEKKIEKILKDEKIDILHNIIPTPSSIISTKAAISLGIKIVTHSHSQPENVFLHLPKFFPKNTLNKAYYKFMYWIYNKADVMIYPTEFAKKFFPDLNSKIRTEIISNGVDINRFKKIDPESFRKKYKIDKTKKQILYLGRFHPEKSIDTLILATPKIIKDYPNSHIILGGSGHMEDGMKALAKKINMEDHITFCGRVSDEELALAYNTADIFVLPSLAELEGMVVLEAMACGKPIVIANAKDSASTYFVKNNGLLFKPEDSADLAEKVLTLLKDDVLRNKMSQRSLEMAQEYDINKSVDALENIYYSLVCFELRN